MLHLDFLPYKYLQGMSCLIPYLMELRKGVDAVENPPNPVIAVI